MTAANCFDSMGSSLWGEWDESELEFVDASRVGKRSRGLTSRRAWPVASGRSARTRDLPSTGSIAVAPAAPRAS